MKTLLALLAFSSLALAEDLYQKPQKEVLDVLNAPLTPTVWISPADEMMLLGQYSSYPPIADLAQPMLRLAGVRINPNTNGVHNAGYWTSLTLKKIADGTEIPVNLPSGARVSAPSWTVDGRQFAFTNTLADGIELWVGETTTGRTRRIEGARLNAILDTGFSWMPDQQTLLIGLIPSRRGAPPAAPTAPKGPKIQESSGKASSSTYEVRDALKNAHDENLFDYYTTTQLAFVNTVSGKIAPIGEPSIFGQISPAPDGNHILVERIHRPYSYLHTNSRFPREVEIWNKEGKVVFKLASLPLADQVPAQGVITGPRAYEWRPTEPATLVWAEALDGGDPKKKVPYRDRILTLKAPFTAAPTEWIQLEQRYTGLYWGEKDGLAFISEFDRDRRWAKVFALNADKFDAKPKLIWDRSVNDRYNNPGMPTFKPLTTGFWVMQQDGNTIYLQGQGASPEGDRPFLDRFDLNTLKAERIFQSAPGSYETVAELINGPGKTILIRHETPTEAPNYYLCTGEQRRAITKFPDPTPQLRQIKKNIVTQKRADGTEISLTYYLPPGYKEGTRLPTVLYAYPLEYSDPSTAGQVVGSAQRFTRLAGTSQLFFLLAGYVVLEPTMPVVGPPDTVYDSFIEQIVSNAKAAIDKAVELGITDPDRVGVMGHSHGALMTANLLAHCDLFRAGIARSGAYNHTLRPFGFQSERRTLWEATDTYLKLSPLMHAKEINEPLLLIHGELDYNPGTVPLQSEKLYEALRGVGATVRFVMLPYESHGYAARESVEHTLYEMISWFDKYVKNAKNVKPVDASTTGK